MVELKSVAYVPINPPAGTNDKSLALKSHSYFKFDPVEVFVNKTGLPLQAESGALNIGLGHCALNDRLISNGKRMRSTVYSLFILRVFVDSKISLCRRFNWCWLRITNTK